MVDIQNNKSNTAIPGVVVIVRTILGLLITCFPGWAFWSSSVVANPDSRAGETRCANNEFSITFLLLDCTLAAVVLVMAFGGGGCCKAKLNIAASCCITLTGAASLVKVFVLTRHTFDVVCCEHKMPSSTSIVCSHLVLFWIASGLLILKLAGNECDDSTRAIAELDAEALVAEIGDGAAAKFRSAD
jgi:hypothetical protein